MNIEELEKTDIWQLYEKGRNYNRMVGLYTDTDKNYRMYNGNQWAGVKISGIEPIQLNIIKPIVKYKVGIINNNLYQPVYSAENIENNDFKEVAAKTCELLNKLVSRVWEKDNMYYKTRSISKHSAINDECPVYVTYDKETNLPINEILSKNEEVVIPNINPVKVVTEEIEKHEEKKKQQAYEIMMSNIDNYDGTGLGQQDIPN